MSNKSAKKHRQTPIEHNKKTSMNNKSAHKKEQQAIKAHKC
jgi:hypothetical protein